MPSVTSAELLQDMPEDNRNKNGKHAGENYTVVLLTTGGNAMFLQVPNVSFQGTYIRKT